MCCVHAIVHFSSFFCVYFYHSIQLSVMRVLHINNIQSSRTSSGSFQHWLPQYRIDIVLVSSLSIVIESGTVFQYRYRPAPQNPVPIHMVQGRFNTVFDPDSRIDFWVCSVDVVGLICIYVCTQPAGCSHCLLHS